MLGRALARADFAMEGLLQPASSGRSIVRMESWASVHRMAGKRLIDPELRYAGAFGRPNLASPCRPPTAELRGGLDSKKSAKSSLSC